MTEPQDKLKFAFAKSPSGRDVISRAVLVGDPDTWVHYYMADPRLRAADRFIVKANGRMFGFASDFQMSTRVLANYEGGPSDGLAIRLVCTPVTGSLFDLLEEAGKRISTDQVKFRDREEQDWVVKVFEDGARTILEPIKILPDFVVFSSSAKARLAAGDFIDDTDPCARE